MGNIDIERAREILGPKGYTVIGSGEYYQIYLNKKTLGKGIPLVTTSYKGVIKEIDSLGSRRRAIRTKRHTKKIKKLLQLEDL